MTNDLTKLRKIAEAATPGPWATETESGVPANTSSGYAVYGEENQERDDLPGITGYHDESTSAENARHIAAFDPPTVLALLAELDQARTTIRAMRLEAMNTASSTDRIVRALDGTE